MEYYYDPNFIRNMQIFSDEEKEYLNRINKSCGEADFFKNQGFFRRFQYEFALTTARIEGSTISKGDVASLIQDGRFFEPGTLTDLLMVKNIADTYRYIAFNDLKVDLHTAHELHQLLANGLLGDPKAIGGMKNVGNKVIGDIEYYPLEPSSYLKSEMLELFNIYNKNIN